MEQGFDWVGTLLNLAPMLLLIVVWIFFMWQMRRRGGYSTQYQRDYMEQVKKHTELLERIATALEKNNFK